MSIATIIPCFRAARWLPSCLESLEAQEVLPQRVCCVFDGPDPDATEIARSYSIVSDILFHEHPSGGAAAPRNTGWSFLQQETQFVHFLDCDDRLMRDFYKQTAGFLGKNSTFHAVSTGHEDQLGGEDLPNMPIQNSRPDSAAVVEWTLFNLPSFTPLSFTLFRSEALTRIARPDRLFASHTDPDSAGPQDLMEDIELIVRFLAEYRWARLPITAGIYHLLDDSISSSAFRTNCWVYNAYAYSLRPWARSTNLERAFASEIERRSSVAARAFARSIPSRKNAVSLLLREAACQSYCSNKLRTLFTLASIMLNADRKRRQLLQDDGSHRKAKPR